MVVLYGQFMMHGRRNIKFRKYVVTHFFYREDGSNRLLGNVVKLMMCDTFHYYAENGNLYSYGLENLIKD